MPESLPSPIHPSPEYRTIRALIEASIAKGRLDVGESADQSVYAFADPAFSNYLIRADEEALASLKNTTSLTPVEYLFNGPAIGTPLLEGHQAIHGRHGAFSIIQKQPGESLFDIQKKEGDKEAALRLANAAPGSIERLFRVAAFVGFHDKPFNMAAPDRTDTGRANGPRIDLNLGNIMLSEDGQLCLIDQMSHEDIHRHKNGRLNDEKAWGSVNYLFDQLRNVIREGRAAGADGEVMDGLMDRIRKAVDPVSRVVHDIEYNRFPDPNKAWAHIKSTLSDPGTEWRGLEDSPTNSPAFQKMHQVSVAALSMDHASTKDLLTALNQLHGASLAHRR